ncbi:MAG: bifunctional diaminohydroxyphosphoribosylaminopyrimidine deaminase/5-amino-6-(5-phosphoribosylamino)uracil reductase RibD [Gammaproteobacteria bacterium]|nr:MAG: bifunctional diaminohydroxyphosphoribosylaminopyrimidine deaminase/5-amino-6-(5-phosphoribosylamino)uracil reductase RibD [Gammaproteobacteria bacterium]
MSVHEPMMARALQLATRGLYTTAPNPRVGCVLVKDNRIVGEGWHQRAGEAHAEVHALEAAGGQARGATMYVTLEPCAHHGRTPPCVDAIIAAGVNAVVIATRDADPRTAGKSVAALAAAGIAVTEGVLEADARALNIGFFSRHERQRPWVRLKLAMSMDGRTAMADGQSQWITGEAARADVQRLRARSDAVITGIGTVKTDDPQLTVRNAAALGVVDDAIRQPLRVVLDSLGHMPATARMLSAPGETLVVTTVVGQPPLTHAMRDKASVLACGLERYVDLVGLLGYLAVQRQCNEVLVEAGATLAGAFIEAGLVDELVVYMAPKLLGHDARPLLQLGLADLSKAPEWEVQDMRAVGDDWRITATPKRIAPERIA